MKVGFEAAVANDNLTGLGTYTRNLLNSFSEMKKMDQLCLIHYTHKNNGENNEKKEALVPRYPFYLSKVFGIPAAVRRCDPDLLHLPVHRCDDFLTYYLNPGVKKVLTVHDLIPFFYDDQRNFQTKYLWVPMLKIVHAKNTLIITVSDHTRKDCEKYLHVPREKIRVIPLAADPVFVQHPDKGAIKVKVSAKFGIPGPFIFYTGSLMPRKNLHRLIEAFIVLKRKGYPHILVIGGSVMGCPSDLRHIISHGNLQRDIRFTGYVTKEDLVDMYNAAEIFVFPSLYEGFGIPPLEAMACGTPVVVSNTSSLPEVVGDAGRLIDPTDSKKLAAALEEILLDEGYRDELSRKGIARSKMFSWEKTGRETWKVYEEIVKSGEA